MPCITLHKCKMEKGNLHKNHVGTDVSLQRTIKLFAKTSQVLQTTFEDLTFKSLD